MTRQNIDKLKLLVSQGAHEMVFTSKWLRSLGINNKLTWWYLHSGWLERIGSKAYKRSGSVVSWEGAVAAIQQQLQAPVYVSGKTALQLLGKAHYLPIGGIKTVELFTLPTLSIPDWLTETKHFSVKFNIHKSGLFNPKTQKTIGLTKQEIDNIQLLVSAPERAIMEVLLDVPKKVSYEESLQLMENLAYLRPQVMQTLLENCRSIKVKRLLLHMAEICQHEWLKELNLKRINLGKGKRKIGSGGNYDSKYQMSVPIIRMETKKTPTPY